MIESIVFTRPAKAAISFNNWAMSGFKLATKDTFELRKEICKSCEFWDNSSFNNTGKCNKCGCSTWAKLRLNTERCPIGKWEVVEKTLE
jgi:hypothetical protein